jgi:ribonuclease J
LELDYESAKITGNIQAGRVLVDGLGVGDVGNIVLRDRKHLAQDGLIIIVTTIDREKGEMVSKPDVISRGFVYVRESEQLIDEIKLAASEAVEESLTKRNMDWAMMKNNVKSSVAKYIYDRTKRNPMILPIIEEV